VLAAPPSAVISFITTKLKMPHVTIRSLEGRSKDQMMTIAQGITKAFTDQGIAEKYVTVRLEEFPRDKFMEEVYEPEVIGGSGELLKEPGYTSL